MALPLILKKLIKLLTIDEEYIFKGQLEDLNAVLKKSKGLKYGMNSEREIEFGPSISWGTLGMGFGIEVKAFVSDLDSDGLRIRLRTSVRPEHYFTVFLFMFLIYVSLIGKFPSEDGNATPVYIEIPAIILIWILFHLVTQFFFRLQENELIEKIVSKLRLKRVEQS